MSLPQLYRKHLSVLLWTACRQRLCVVAGSRYNCSTIQEVCVIESHERDRNVMQKQTNYANRTLKPAIILNRYALFYDNNSQGALVSGSIRFMRIFAGVP